MYFLIELLTVASACLYILIHLYSKKIFFMNET